MQLRGIAPMPASVPMSWTRSDRRKWIGRDGVLRNGQRWTIPAEMTPTEFAQLHMPALERDEARHNKILPILARLAEGTGTTVATWTLGAAGACAVCASDRILLLREVDD